MSSPFKPKTASTDTRKIPISFVKNIIAPHRNNNGYSQENLQVLDKKLNDNCNNKEPLQSVAPIFYHFKTNIGSILNDIENQILKYDGDSKDEQAIPIKTVTDRIDFYRRKYTDTKEGGNTDYTHIINVYDEGINAACKNNQKLSFRFLRKEVVATIERVLAGIEAPLLTGGNTYRRRRLSKKKRSRRCTKSKARKL